MSTIPHSWARIYSRGTDVQDIVELLSMDGLDLKMANGTDLPYKGWMELTFSLAVENSQHTMEVPFLAS